MDHKVLAKSLRKIFVDVAPEPLPPRFVELLGDHEPSPFGGASGARPVQERKSPTSYRSTEPKVMRRTRGM